MHSHVYTLRLIACAAIVAAAGSGPARVLALTAEDATPLWNAVEANTLWLDGMGYGTALPRARLVRLEPEVLEQLLTGVAFESAGESPSISHEITLPMPDGTDGRFWFVESPIMAPELAAKFPEIRTYAGQGLDDPAAALRFDRTPAGFHAQVLSPSGAVYIEPHRGGGREQYVSYYGHDQRATPGLRCLTTSEHVPPSAFPRGEAGRTGETLRTFRLACAATGEYTLYHGASVPEGMAAIVTAINRVTGIYETELAVRLELVADNDLLVYTDWDTDPYSNNNASALLTQNQANIDSVIGSANYDIGHVFSTGGGGLAYIGVVCLSGWKAKGETGLAYPTGDSFYIDYVAHEMGHQFGAHHCFNGDGGYCGAGRYGSTAYAPGSGSTIMAYADLCGADNLQDHSDPYFHAASRAEIQGYISAGGGGCAATNATSNTAPIVDGGDDYTIPRSTPFALTASANDPDDDPLTYCWEEFDLGPQASLADPDNGSSPLFRSWSPTTDSSRTFPRLTDLLGNTTAPGEQLPTTNRTLQFRVSARDNRVGGGGVETDDVNVTVDVSSGPFRITSPTDGTEVWSGVALVSWNVAGTDTPPVDTAYVNILFSYDGGATYPVVLAAETPNDGLQPVLVPHGVTSTARVKIEAVGNIFFDVARQDFSVEQVGTGDFKPDGDVDLADFAGFQLCYGVEPLTPTCAAADLNGDQAVDLTDHALFVAQLSAGGPNPS
ncbi:MAG: hypothetical protein GY842_26785 [bacterium]|nr:hypothetical protein [bacterium]